jgi:hypothetical protein
MNGLRERFGSATEPLTGPAGPRSMLEVSLTDEQVRPLAVYSPPDCRELVIGPAQLVKHTVATGGLILVGDRPAHRLTPIQFDLVEALGRQLSLDASRHEAVRGFVSSSELLSTLPWDTAHPDLNHLKQLVRRVRARLKPLGMAVQSRAGLGYRLAFS